MRAATRVQETPCAHLTTSVDTHLILICVPEDFNTSTAETLSSRASDAETTPTSVRAPTRRDEHFCHVLFLYAYTHTGGRPGPLGFLRREEARRRSFTELSAHFSVKNKKKKEKRRAPGSGYICCFLVCVFWRNDYRSANKQRLLNVYSVMLLYIVYYGPRQLGNQAYFKGARGGGGSIFKHYDDKNHKPPSTRYTSLQTDTV